MPEEAYSVVVNGEGQYSIWETTRPRPHGWRDAGFEGTREECLAHIESVWTDMRPASVRRRVEEDSP
jgi:MbtH protein